MQEYAAVKRLMLGADNRKTEVGIEIFASHIGQAQRDVRQLRKPLGLVGIGDEPGGIDDDLAAIEPRPQKLAEHLGRERLHSEVRTLMRTELYNSPSIQTPKVQELGMLSYWSVTRWSADGLTAPSRR
jgi:hypothetical protein